MEGRAEGYSADPAQHEKAYISWLPVNGELLPVNTQCPVPKNVRSGDKIARRNLRVRRSDGNFMGLSHISFSRILLIATTFVFANALAAEKVPHPPGPNHGESPYQVVQNWLQPFAPSGFVWGSQPGIFVESTKRIFIIQRGQLRVPDPKPDGFTNFYGSSPGLSALQPVDKKRDMHNVIFIVNSNGKLLETWTQWDYLFADTPGPHKIEINPRDPEKRVWVVNDARQQIHVFSNDGKKLLFSLGTWNEAGSDKTHFGKPQDVAWLSDGSILVADGLDNSRVVKFDSKGNYLMEWGTKGKADGQFDVVHAVATDKRDRVYIADRANERIQVFDANGKHLKTWPDLNFPNHILITANQEVW
ncbi:MAG TPA: hypothetical protein VET48_10360, partial [Steroidobacteraceae bacterium]|nr:hypothetical protein [Steroidobacteraceae bacterium]